MEAMGDSATEDSTVDKVHDVMQDHKVGGDIESVTIEAVNCTANTQNSDSVGGEAQATGVDVACSMDVTHGDGEDVDGASLALDTTPSTHNDLTESDTTHADGDISSVGVGSMNPVNILADSHGTSDSVPNPEIVLPNASVHGTSVPNPEIALPDASVHGTSDSVPNPEIALPNASVHGTSVPNPEVALPNASVHGISVPNPEIALPVPGVHETSDIVLITDILPDCIDSDPLNISDPTNTFSCSDHDAGDNYFKTNTETKSLTEDSDVAEVSAVTDMGDHVSQCCSWPPFVVVGGPGTGKSESLAYACLSLFHGWGQADDATRILIAAHTVRGSDTLVTDILRPAEELSDVTLARIYCPATPTDNISEEIQDICYIGDDNMTYMPKLCDLNEATIVVTTFDMLEHVYCPHNSEAAPFTHILLDDAHLYSFAKLCKILESTPNDVCTVITLNSIVPDDRRRLVRNIDVASLFHSDLMRLGFISDLQSVLSQSDDASAFRRDNFERLHTNRSYCSTMLGFVNACIVEPHDNMRVSNQPEADLPALVIYHVTRSSCVDQVAAHVDALYGQWPDTWSDPCPSYLAVVSEHWSQLQHVRDALMSLSEKYSTVSLLTPEMITGLHFNAVFIITLAHDETVAIPECFIQPDSLLITLTRARYHLAIFVEETTRLSESSQIWRRIFHYGGEVYETSEICSTESNTNRSNIVSIVSGITERSAAIDLLNEAQDLIQVDVSTQSFSEPQTEDKWEEANVEGYNSDDSYDSACNWAGGSQSSDDLSLDYDDNSKCALSRDIDSGNRYGNDEQFMNADGDCSAEYQYSSAAWDELRETFPLPQVMAPPWPVDELQSIPSCSRTNSESDGWGSEPKSDNDMTFRGDHPTERYNDTEDRLLMESKVAHYLVKNKDVFVSNNDEEVLFNTGDGDSYQDTGFEFPDHSYDAKKEVEDLYPDWYTLPDPRFINRLDYKTLFTITVGDSEDCSMAFTVRNDTPNDRKIVIIHVTDVDFFVGRGSAMDEDAAERGCTLRIPGKDPVHMLPPRLSTDLCSLLPDKDRFAFSMIVGLDSHYNVVNREIKRSVVNVSAAVTHDTVDQYLRSTISEEERNEDIVETLEILQVFSDCERKRRLGNANIAFSSLESVSTSVLMVNELSMFMNHHIAECLTLEFDMCTPLLNQPNPLSLGWKKRYADIAGHSLALSYHYLDPFNKCHCQSKCHCVTSYPQNPFHKELPKTSIRISKSRWSKVHAAYQSKDTHDLSVLLADVWNYPETVLALYEVSELMKDEVYVAAIDTNRGHHMLNLPVYTTCTRPLQRYIDLVIQRILRAYITSMTMQYTANEIDEICYNATNTIKYARSAELAEYNHMVTEALKVYPLVVEMVVSKIDAVEIQLANPIGLHSPSRLDNSREILYKPSLLLDAKFVVKFNKLMVSQKPCMVDERVSVVWQERIYSLDRQMDVSPVIAAEGTVFPLCADYLVRHVPMEEIDKLSVALRSCDQVSMVQATKSITEYIEKEDTNVAMKDISSEIILTQAGEPGICNFSVDYEIESSVRVQLACGIDKTTNLPSVQLMSLTPTIDICVEHNVNKAVCFVVTPTERVDDDSYLDIKEYKRRWNELLWFEAAESAISENDGAYIHDVTIEWMRDEHGAVSGSFKIPESFRYNRRIPSSGFICVRYKNVKVEDGVLTPLLGLYTDQDSYTWVGHCVINKMSHKYSKKTDGKFGTPAPRAGKWDRISFKYFDSCSKIPEVLFTNEGKVMVCTIQGMDMPRPHSLMIETINHISSDILSFGDHLFAGTLSITEIKEPRELDTIQLPPMSSIPVLNPEQQLAVDNALSKNFALIHGPPGTGKTAAAARLIYLMVKRNQINQFQTKGEAWQIMYCAPSNKAADVILGYFRKMRSEQPIVIRNYSNRIERHDFGTNEQMKNKETSSFIMNKDYKRFALHHIIRERMKPFATTISSMDRTMKEQPEVVNKTILRDYHKVIQNACQQELSKAEVIVTTCTGCLSFRFCLTKIRQLVIDEAGMCSQPETLIPVMHRPRQVTLIGDHKQLQPVLITDPAKELGMLRSLFERYADQAIMLSMQYRMHEKIMAVPSACFYDNKLCCGSDDQMKPSPLAIWPGGVHAPIVLCHVIGSEAVTTVSTKESNDRSKSNEQEADIVNKIVRRLISDHQIPEKEIAILTQYRAQHSLLESLIAPDHANVTINTVITSQGDEWEYVILSTVRTLDPYYILKSPSDAWVRKHLGFITDTHQINVALTRAKRGLIIVGNKLLLKCHPDWKRLVKFYERHGAVIDAENFIQQM